MKKSGGFVWQGHKYLWNKQSKNLCLRVWLYVDSFDELEETSADRCFLGETLKDAIAKCKNWLAEPKNLKPYQAERLGAIAS